MHIKLRHFYRSGPEGTTWAGRNGTVDASTRLTRPALEEISGPICKARKLVYGERLGTSLIGGFRLIRARSAGFVTAILRRGSVERTRDEIFSQKAVAMKVAGGKIRAPFLQGFFWKRSNPFKAT